MPSIAPEATSFPSGLWEGRRERERGKDEVEEVEEEEEVKYFHV